MANIKRPKPRATYKKIITSDIKLEKVNTINKQLQQRFLQNYSTKRSPKTVKNYESNLNIFFCWNYEFNENLPYTDLKKFHFLDFFDYCVNELKWGSNRYAQMHSCLSSFSTWISNYYDERFPEFSNIVLKIEKLPPKLSRRKSVFSKRDLDALMGCLGVLERPQEQCLLALLMSSGMRIGEVERFTVDLIDEKKTAFDGLFYETTREVQTKGRGVDGKHLTRYLIKDFLKPYYDNWLIHRKKIMDINNQDHNYLFITANGSPAKESTIRYWTKDWDNLVNKHFYPHAIRHFWTTYLLQCGLEPEFVKSLQGWSSDTMVETYNDATFKERNWKSLNKLKVALANNGEPCDVPL